jgi:pectate lyase
MKKSILFIAFALCVQFISAQQLAFPGADGFGKHALGGRGGSVYHVTNLNDSGPGSFRDAVSQPKRTVVFDISGVIKIQSKLTVASFITIAGQSAPGDGIVVYGNGISMTGATDVIIRHIRFRGSVAMGRGACTVSSDNTKDIIFDHVSIEWGRWDNFHIKDSKDITVQYCLLGEGINPQMFGALLENPTNITIHHCLWVDNQSRNPKAKAGIEIINNVVYNWGSNGLVGGHSGALHHQDIINNYFIAGPNSSHAFIGMFSATDHVYHAGNMVDMNKNGKLDGRIVTDEDFLKTGATLEPKTQNSSFALTGIELPEVACKKVLAQAGASLHRDDIDKRLVGYVKSLGKTGKVIKAESEVGGQKDMKPATAKKDTDGDGIPDSWESKHQLNPNDPQDANRINPDGYSSLETYLNELAFQK